jgi:integrase
MNQPKPRKAAMNFTAETLRALRPPEAGVATYYDGKERGLACYVLPSGRITFFIRKYMPDRTQRRIWIGNFPDMTVQRARTAVRRVKGRIAQREDPTEEKRRAMADRTFGEGFQDYLERYAMVEKRTWKCDIWEVNRFLGHWARRKLCQIRREDVMEVRERIARENGKVQSNHIVKRISAIYNRLISWGWKGENPAAKVERFREKSRDRFVLPEECPRLLKAIYESPNGQARDYFLLCLMTGARRSNMLAMEWKDIDWELSLWRIPDTKNGDPLDVPLVEDAVEILKQRRNRGEKSPYVFPSQWSRSGHYASPDEAWKSVLRRAAIENLRIHDLRRTLGSYQAITGASIPIIGKTLGHRSLRSTQIYARLFSDPVRAAMEKAKERMFVDFAR